MSFRDTGVDLHVLDEDPADFQLGRFHFSHGIFLKILSTMVQNRQFLHFLPKNQTNPQNSPPKTINPICLYYIVYAGKPNHNH